MNKKYRLLLLSVALGIATTGCSDDAKYKAMAEKYNALQAEKAKQKAMSAEEMHHAIPMSHELSGAHKIDTDEIGRNADDLPPPLNRTQAQLVRVDLYTEELVAEMMPEVTYQYWTYNGKVPGPFIRARVGDQVEIHLSHGKPGASHQGHNEHIPADHAAAGHSAHSIDLHAVAGPGGGAPLMQVGQGEEKSFRFKAAHPGIYVYHCASPHVPTHI
ncbi:MAG: multicopper oxidase domain-containing protein, partial [Methylococcales bacterium]|nr:multicopper oxidase domain-containing protein [Methylococcales bacterium]